jgi:hypothetical protein
MNSLKYRPNACSLCLIYLVCTKTYDENCTCPPKELKWKRKSDEYKIDFRHKALDMVAARKQKIKLDNEFISWFHDKISLKMETLEDKHDVNVCRRCINKYDYYKKGTYLVYLNITIFLFYCVCNLLFFNI